MKSKVRSQLDKRKRQIDHAHQRKLLDDTPYLFYISNIPRHECSDRQVVFHANDRCDQENIISQLHSMGALAAPLDNLIRNWAYMVDATLAWSLKYWSADVLPMKPKYVRFPTDYHQQLRLPAHAAQPTSSNIQ